MTCQVSWQEWTGEQGIETQLAESGRTSLKDFQQ